MSLSEHQVTATKQCTLHGGFAYLPFTPTNKGTHLQVQTWRSCSYPTSWLCYLLHCTSPTRSHKTAAWTFHLLNEDTSSSGDPGCPSAEMWSRLCNPPHVLRFRVSEAEQKDPTTFINMKYESVLFLIFLFDLLHQRAPHSQSQLKATISARKHTRFSGINLPDLSV